jgi:hypothetical protein
MNKSDVKRVLVESIQRDSFFSEFQWIKSQNLLVTGFDNQRVLDMIEIELESTYDQNDNLIYLLHLNFMRQFKDLHEWALRFSFKSKTDLKYQYSIIFDNSDCEISVKIDKNQQINENNIAYVINYMKQKFLWLREQYPTLLEVYYKYAAPLLKGKERIPYAKLVELDEAIELTYYGVDWIFESLYLTKVYQPIKLKGLYNRLKKHFGSLCEIEEPNAVHYKENFEEIVSFIGVI